LFSLTAWPDFVQFFHLFDLKLAIESHFCDNVYQWDCLHLRLFDPPGRWNRNHCKTHFFELTVYSLFWCESNGFCQFLFDYEIILQQADKIATLVKSAGVTVESYWPSLFAKLSEKRNIEDLILNAASGGGGAAPVAVAAPAAAAVAPKVEEKV
jgi:large subunit ribosomal protein LP1